MLRKCMMCVMLSLIAATGLAFAVENPARYVDPMIGSDGHGHVFVGACAPFGLAQAGPTQYTRGWDWCSGYHYSDSILLGFSQMHLSGTGIGELGDICILPVTDASTRSIKFSHDQEEAAAGYYRLGLGCTGVTAEMTATQRVAMHRISYPADSAKLLILDLCRGIGWDSPTDVALEQTGDSELVGYRRSTGWAKDRIMHFCLQTDAKIAIDSIEGRCVAVLRLQSAGPSALVKIGLSPVSSGNARLNIEAELPHWDFDKARRQAEQAWDRELGRIDIATADTAKLRTFYTALYHTMIAPSVFCDVNGEYYGADGKIRKGDFVNYTTLSLWDAYRAAFPLYTLTQRERIPDMAATMLRICYEQGKLPVWHLMGNETDCMVGNPAVPILADIAAKGFDIDVAAAYRAARKSQLLDERGLGALKRYGFIPYDVDTLPQTVSRTLEYAIADAGAAKLAELAGAPEAERRYFAKRSKSYRKLYDPATGFIRALASDGSRRVEFNPFTAVHEADDYTEGNAWQYLWLVPHDPAGLIGLLGGPQAFVDRLDSLFVAEGSLGDSASPDISGLIGQYAHGNEPCHHVAYLYSYAGRPDKTARVVDRVVEEMYGDGPDGLCGNEDVGQMSAWYVLSALGLYQVDLNNAEFVIGSPQFDRASIDLGNGKTFTIIKTEEHQNTLNETHWDSPLIPYSEIIKGGTLRIGSGR